MMKNLYFSLLGASCILFLSISAQEEDRKPYTTKFDNIDIDAVIRNERLLNNYVGCLLEKSPCTPDASELKKNLPDALATDCSSCSEAQKRIADKLSHYLIDHRPVDWTFLEEKFDPTGAYRERYLHSKEMEIVTDSNDETISKEMIVEDEPAITKDEDADKD